MPVHVRMSARDPDEAHRGATPLELFLDLTFVVAVAQATVSVHHGLVDGDVKNTLITFPLVFFAIFWTWVNFTWFASAYDTDDALYRLAVFVQVTGVLIFAAGIPRAFEDQDYVVITAGYVVLRIALVGQWLRAAASHPAGRASALRFAVGITLVQAGWVLRLALPDSLLLPTSLLLVAAELAVPVWAEAAGRTSWHPGHIAERYGLFTIIVLGESVLAATVGVQLALDADGTLDALLPIIVGGLLAVFSMWWIYFDAPAGQVIERARLVFTRHPSSAFVWGYGHYWVLLGATGVGAGLAVAVDQATHPTELTDAQAGLTLTVPVTIYLLSVWGLYFRAKPPSAMHRYSVPIAAVLVLASSASTEPVLITGLLLAGLVTMTLVVVEPKVGVKQGADSAEQ